MNLIRDLAAFTLEPTEIGTQLTRHSERPVPHRAQGQASGPYRRPPLGPSAWKANEDDSNWRNTVDPAAADYSHLFLTRARFREVRQSAVTLEEVLDGIPADDRRLRDEILAFWTYTGP